MSPTNGKRRRSPSPNSLLRRVKPRMYAGDVSEPEEGEVEDTPSTSPRHHGQAKNLDQGQLTKGNSNIATKESNKIEVSGSNGTGSSKVPFPFKRQQDKIKSLPKADLENGLPSRPSRVPSPRVSSRNGDSYRPEYDDRERGRRERHWSPPRRRYDDHWRGYSPQREDREGGRERDGHRNRGGARGADSYVPSYARSPPRHRSRSPHHRRPSRSPTRGDHYRPPSPHTRFEGRPHRSRSPNGDYYPRTRPRSRSRTPPRSKNNVIHRLPERARYSPPLLHSRSLVDRLAPPAPHEDSRDVPRHGSRDVEDRPHYEERVPSVPRSRASRSPPARHTPPVKPTELERRAPTDDDPGLVPSARPPSPAQNRSTAETTEVPQSPNNMPPLLPPPIQIRAVHPLPARPPVPEAFFGNGPPPSQPPSQFVPYPPPNGSTPTLAMAPPPSQPPYGPPPPHLQQPVHLQPPGYHGYPQGPHPHPPYPPHPYPQHSYPHPPQPQYQHHHHQQQQHPPPPPPPQPQPSQRSYSPMMPPPPPKPKKEAKLATVRTKEQERFVYGRTFVGSGRLSEYDIRNKLGEGTFGEVHRATHKATGRDVALKRILMHNEKDGMPITALREIKILKALDHKNIVKVLDIVVTPRKPDIAGSIHMVFPYMDHDLAGLLENPAVKLQPSHIKLYMKQLFEGLEYMHENNIVHRDIKAANLLISHDGTLQIADFGLARAYAKGTKMEKQKRNERYTNCVVTRWYRPPELLMGERYYGGEIDIWGVGCILVEMFTRKPILPGSSDLDQLEKIWTLCGTPTPEAWPDFETLPGLDGVKSFKPRPKTLRNVLDRIEALAHDCKMLIEQLLTLDPARRPTATDALLHEYFWCDPLPADPEKLPKFESSHELDRRRKAPQQQQQNGLPQHPQHPRGPARYPSGPGGQPHPPPPNGMLPRPHGQPPQGGAHLNWRNGPGPGPPHGGMPHRGPGGDRRQGRPPFKGQGNLPQQPLGLHPGLPARPDFVGRGNGAYGPPPNLQPHHSGPPPAPWPTASGPPPTASGGLNYG